MRHLFPPRARVSVFFAAALALSGVEGLAQDWTQWRGPARDGAVPASVVPKAWPSTTTRTWQVEVGEGYASPVVANGRVFIHSRTDPNETVMAIDLASGTVAWRQTYAAPFQKNQYAKDMAKGPNSTPLVAGSRVYTLGVTGVLSAWSAADGTLAWRQDYSSSIDTSKLFCGTAMSPMIEGGSLIVQQFVALDAATGAVKWATVGRDGNHASILLAPNHVMFLNDGGVLLVARRGGDTFVAEKRIEIGSSATWSVPVLLADGLLVREANSLVRLAWGR